VNKEELIELIESKTSWTLAKHRSAEQLLEYHNSKEIRQFIWDLFVKTGDYYYCSILKLYKK
jgi:hypothetical protein